MPETVVTVSGVVAHERFSSVEVAALFKRLRPALVRFFERRSFSLADAEDLTQEVFIKLTRLDESANIWQPEAFLFQVAANVLRDKLRRDTARCRNDHVSFDETMTDHEEPSEESVYEGMESLQRMLTALLQLTPKCRTVFVLHKYEGLAYSEIARRFGISVSAVEKHMIHAVKHLKLHWRGQS